MLQLNRFWIAIAGVSLLAGSGVTLTGVRPAIAQFFTGPLPANQSGVYNPNFPPPYSLATPSAGSGPSINQSTLVNPTIINSTINNSTLINPTVINSSVNGSWVSQPIVLPVAVNAQVLVADVLSPDLVLILQSYRLANNYRYYRQINANAVYLQIDQGSWSLLSAAAKLQLLQRLGNFYASQGISVIVQSYGQVGLGQYICNGPAICTPLVLL